MRQSFRAASVSDRLLLFFSRILMLARFVVRPTVFGRDAEQNFSEYWRLLAVQDFDQHRERFIHRVFGKFFPRHPENLGRVAAALRPFHPRLRGLPTDAALLGDEATLRSSAILRLTTGMADLDLVARASSRRSARRPREGPGDATRIGKLSGSGRALTARSHINSAVHI
jgi:hypothetical protein